MGPPPRGMDALQSMEAYTSDKTQAKCLTLLRGQPRDEILGQGELASKIPVIKSALEECAGPPVFFLITAPGDPNKDFAIQRNCSLQISNDKASVPEFDLLNKLLGVNEVSYGVYTTARPNCTYVLEYDETLQELKAIIFSVRCPIVSRSIVSVVRIQFPDMSCVASVTCPEVQDLERLRALCKSNEPFLRASPLGLLTLIYELRGYDYEQWVIRLWKESNEIEGFLKMAPPGWTFHPVIPGTGRFQELSDTDKLLTQLQNTDIEICHGHSIMAFAVRYAAFILNAIDVIETKRKVGEIAPGARAMVEDRTRFTQARCHAVQERIMELAQRHRGQINASFSLIAQKDSKINRAVAEISVEVARVAAVDSRTMKTIGILTLVFLPSSLVTSVWQANVFHLDDETNAKVYAGTTIAVTALVFFCWWIFMQFSRKPLDRYQAGSLRAGLPIV